MYKIFLFEHNQYRGVKMGKKHNLEIDEDVTKYGEFVCSAYHWVTPKEQKRKAERMENITDENERKKE